MSQERKGFQSNKFRLSRSPVYHYFPDKEAVFTVLIERSMEASTQHIRAVLEMEGSPWERLEWWLSRAMTWMRKHPEVILFMTQVLINEPAHETLRRLVYQLGRASHQELRQLIVEGQQEKLHLLSS